MFLFALVPASPIFRFKLLVWYGMYVHAPARSLDDTLALALRRCVLATVVLVVTRSIAVNQEVRVNIIVFVVAAAD